MDEKTKRAFVDAVREKRQSMYRAAYSVLMSPCAAEDAVSEAVENCWKRLDKMRDLRALPAYLVKSAFHAAIAEKRKRKRLTPLDSLGDTLPADDGGSPLWHYVAHLDDKHRVPLMLKYGENMQEKEIASLLHLPRGTVSSRIVRALKQLKTEMEREEGRGP